MDPRDTVLNKKYYEGVNYYKVKSAADDSVTWMKEEDLKISKKTLRLLLRNLDDTYESEDEWEVEAIVDHRAHEGKTQYLLKWRNWPGPPTWEDADKCECINLIAAYENPKLRKLWNFKGNNPRLWMPQDVLIGYMRKYVEDRRLDVNIIDFRKDFPRDEEPYPVEDGINIGPLSYEGHYFLVIVLVKHICISKRILVGDSLNTLTGVRYRSHPVHKRLTRTYPRYQIKPLRFTQMDRSDMCAFYTLAAFERALFLMSSRASLIVDSIIYDPKRAELIRSEMKPETDGDISVALPIPEDLDQGPCCEFCDRLFDTRKQADKHILRRHMRRSASCV